MTPIEHSTKAALGGILLGIGLGGFIDMIVLRELLQWHGMVSNWIPPQTVEALSANQFWDGVFQALLWFITFAGVLSIWHAARRKEYIQSARTLLGQLLFGWGLVNLIETLVGGVVLGLHNVREVPDHTLYNWTFIGVGGVLFLAIGWLLSKQGRLADEGLHLKLPGFGEKKRVK
jgi:uncharacterized membrane protein